MDVEQLIAARPTARRHLATWYSELLDAAEQEGLSVAELADRLGVVKETIYAWRRRSVAAAPFERESKSAPALVRVRVVDPERPSTSRPSLELRLQGSRRILVPAGFDVDTLVALVATLERC